MTYPVHETQANSLIFWSGTHVDVQHSSGVDATGSHSEAVASLHDHHGDEVDSVSSGPAPHKRVSSYVDLFETMISTVLESESHLFSQPEINALQRLTHLSYSARYLLVRLSLRKRDKWHRLSSLNYHSELGDDRRITSAIHELTGTPEPVNKESTQSAPDTTETRVVIDLTLDDDDDDFDCSVSRESHKDSSNARTELHPIIDLSIDSDLLNETPDDDLTDLAIDESKMTLLELLECLTVDELKNLARRLKIRGTNNRTSLITAILTFSSTQRMIEFPTAHSKSIRDKLDPFRGHGDRLREMILVILGKCVRVNSSLYKLFKRIDLVYFRCTEYSPTLLTPALLARFRKRFYPFYKYTRTPNIWCSREELLAYESALELQASVLGLIDGDITATRKEGSVRPSVHRDLSHCSEQDKENIREEGANDGEQEVQPETVTDKIKHARTVHEIFVARIYPKWLELVHERNTTDEPRIPGLERFDCGHVYTRMVHKCTRILGILKQHQFELEVLEKLLGQRLWLRGKRGRWHDRRTLILMTYCGNEGDAMRKALNAAVEALEDNDTHLYHRPMLVRRLVRLEKKLRVPPESCHRCEGEIEKAIDVYIKGLRVWKPAATPDSRWRGLAGRSSMTPTSLSKAWGSLSPISANARSGKIVASTSKTPSAFDKKDHRPQHKGKSVWRGQDGEQVTVEALALQHYEGLGYKGYHSEGSIVRTLFGLLFFDIIFASIPGAFETPYQSAPLDIAEDSFYFARKDLIERRLEEIEAGAAAEIVERVDGDHREKKTWCVGVHWDLFERPDLLEIVDCVDGKWLSSIFRLFCEDYAARGAGLPDLFLWNPKEGTCKFVEVKGPGDTLRENQKVWIDFLLRIGMPLEICHVNETGTAEKKRKKKPVDGANAKRRKSGNPSVEEQQA